MKKILALLIFCGIIQVTAFAQPEPTAKEMHETSKTFMRQGDYDNAILVLKKALEKEPSNLEMLKDLTLLYFLKRDYAGAMQTGKPLIERSDADVQCFQILGLTYKAIAEYKECRKLYKKGLAKFPNSGILYNDYGELLAIDNDLNNAIIHWEKGIEADPNLSNNYYNAVKYYAQNTKPDLFWITFYGEIFVNLESYTARTIEVKKIIVEGYKKIYASGNIQSISVSKKIGDFEKATLNYLSQSSSLASDGVTAETLLAIKTRFVLDWFESAAYKYPCRLYEHYQHMLKEGVFEGYCQWLYGSVSNPAAYDLWVKANEKQAEAFKKFQTARIYKTPVGQYYR